MRAWKWPSFPNVSAATGSIATTNGIARQCTIQIVDREIAMRSRYLDAAMGETWWCLRTESMSIPHNR